MHKLLLFAVLAAALLSGCNKSASTPAAASSAGSAQPASAPGGNAMDAQLQKLAGAGATSCGRVAGNGDVKPATDCALQASQAKRAFYVAYDLPGMTVGLAGASDGKLYSVNSTEQAYSPEDAKSGAQLSDNNHILTVACPAALRVAQSGRATCFPVSSAPGASPHGGMGGGGMMGAGAGGGANPHGGAMAAPAGSENPHGQVGTTPGKANPHGGKLPPKTASDK
jgi:hypothetical protein